MLLLDCIPVVGDEVKWVKLMPRKVMDDTNTHGAGVYWDYPVT